MEYRLQELFVGPFQLNESPDQSINLRVVLYNGLGTHIVYLKPEQITVYLKVRRKPNINTKYQKKYIA